MGTNAENWLHRKCVIAAQNYKNRSNEEILAKACSVAMVTPEAVGLYDSCQHRNALHMETSELP
jgi:hypothetical protein